MLKAARLRGRKKQQLPFILTDLNAENDEYDFVFNQNNKGGLSDRATALAESNTV